MPRTESQKNELRVFISSTFQDLQEEREHLVKKIFPEIRSLCRERGITFTEVDLRWGLTEEEGTLGRIIRTCLEEIDRCHPYFIGVTGKRYGYIPDVTDIYKDSELLAKYPWVEDAASEQMSIIEMEFRHGALNALTPVPSPSGRGVAEGRGEGRAAFFFRRQREQLSDRPAGDRWTRQESDDDAARLEALKQEVRAARLPVEEFRDPVSLGEMVYDELVRIINRDYADAKPPTPLEEARSRHHAFAASRRHAYIPNPLYLKRLNEFVDFQLEGNATAAPLIENPKSKIQNALIVYAESGSGKSSLVSFWADQYKRKHPDMHVVEHYVGIGAGSTDHLAVMRHVMEEIKERFNRDEEIPATPEEIERQFANWLGFTKTTPVVLILDGLNQLQGAALNLTWLPKFIPANFRLIITSTVEGTLVQLRERGWQQLGMQPLTEKEREAIIVRFLSEYHKALSPDQVKRITGDMKCAHPLFLRTLLEELRVFGQHERLDREIDRYLGTTGTEDLFQVVMERIEEDFGARAVREIMGLIWASRIGLSEIELQELTSLSRMKVNTLMMSLDYHLVYRDGLYSFFHDYLRRAVEKRYLPDEAKQLGEHIQLADYFQQQVDEYLAADRAKAKAAAQS